jgi:hypothetical protein
MVENKPIAGKFKNRQKKSKNLQNSEVQIEKICVEQEILSDFHEINLEYMNGKCVRSSRELNLPTNFAEQNFVRSRKCYKAFSFQPLVFLIACLIFYHCQTAG